MNFKPALLFFAIIAAIFMIATADRSFAQNPPGEPVDAAGDVTLVRDNIRIQERNAGIYQPDATILAPGIDCPSGTCYKDTAPPLGYDTTPQIVPSGDIAPGDTKSTKTKK